MKISEKELELRKKALKKFVIGHKPLMLEIDGKLQKVAHVKNNTLKWIIRNKGQRLNSMNFIAKDDSIIDIVQGQVTLIEVADAVDGNIYSISYQEFQDNQQPFYESSTGKQWMVERKHWRKTPLVDPKDLLDPEEALQTSLFDIGF
jgi:hypothetical protein